VTIINVSQRRKKNKTTVPISGLKKIGMKSKENSKSSQQLHKRDYIFSLIQR
jgi:hypothetical protein